MPSDEDRESRALPVSLYPELDGALLTRFVGALESGDTAGLAPLRAEEATEARRLVRFSRVTVSGAYGAGLDGALWKHPPGEPRPLHGPLLWRRQQARHLHHRLVTGRRPLLPRNPAGLTVVL
ncbi:hypothetical protein J1792_25170 [Streptomyces triculaminicus]|uniref:Uncharacterized protein n=2 Tax=Streptomyces TaxID=1883 RepID=A0A939FSB1_9ACTN|nr:MULTISPECIES: hypothetical protein [Streptomyces]MBO0655939.1 hypothetical protein [Streptomyces triculaminicus]QSY49937.1 hypothetical protein J3S04_02340 [Streptomyces griseocarneus]